MDTTRITRDFFDRYTQALLARDAAAIAHMYAVPALILFPGQSIPVTDPAQTEEFFTTAWEQYEAVRQTSTDVTLLAATDHAIWADVTWHHDHAPQERLCYQLVRSDADQWRIAVLTPIA